MSEEKEIAEIKKVQEQIAELKTYLQKALAEIEKLIKESW